MKKELTPEQKKVIPFVEEVVTKGWPNDPGNAQRPIVPPPDAATTWVDELIGAMGQPTDAARGEWRLRSA